MGQTVNQRIAFSVIANAFRSLMAFGTGLLIARGLGPDSYGLMMFLLGTFVAVQQLFDLGASVAFFTFLSERDRSWKFVSWYFFWLGLQLVISLLCISILLPDYWIEKIWLGEDRYVISLAFLATFLQHTLWTAVLRMGESQRLTILVQSVSSCILAIHFCFIVIGFLTDWLGIRSIFLLTCVEWLIANIFVFRVMSFSEKVNAGDNLIAVFQEYWKFCLPLIPYAYISFCYEFADRWLLQSFGGSSEQAYYAVANQISMIAGLATVSIVNIFWKEIAAAHEQKDYEVIAIYYYRFSRGLFFFCSFIAAFMVFWSSEIIEVLLGESYSAGVLTLKIMVFYPIYSSMWEVSGVLALASKRVILHVTFGSFFKISSIFAAYYILSPEDGLISGLNLGSSGLALKMVIMQFLVANAFSYYLCRTYKMKFDWLFQPVAIISCVCLSYFSYWVSHSSFDVTNGLLVTVSMSAIIYILLIAFLIVIAPSLVGMDRSDLSKFKKYFSHE